MPNRRDILPFLYRPQPGGHGVTTRVDLRTLAFFVIILVLIGLAGWLYLRRASEVASYAHEIRVLERDKERLHRELIALRAEVAARGSLGRVLEVGKQFGYHLPASTDTTRHLRLAYQMTLPEPTPTAEPLAGGELLGSPPIKAGGLLGRLLAQLRTWLQTDIEPTP